MLEGLPKRGPNLNLLPHVLTITLEPGDETYDPEKGYEVEHHECCPLVCDWSPWYSQWWNGPDDGTYMFLEARPEREAGHYSCYVAYELDSNGLDSLDIHTLEGDAHIDADWVPGSRFEADWMRLHPGRYTIEGWYTPFQWAGSEPIDADGGLVILDDALVHLGSLEALGNDLADRLSAC